MTDIVKKSQVSAETTSNGEPSNYLVSDPFISDETCRVLESVLYVGLAGSISVFGSVANVINIIIFVKQGLSDSVNIGLCGLSASDLLSLLALVWKSICMNPLFQNSDIGFDSVQFQYATAGLPRGGIVLVTSWITTFITFERCVCMALPMKVKTIITPKRTLIYVVVIFITMLGIATPAFCSVHFAPVFQAKRNKTIIGIIYDNNYANLQNTSFRLHIFLQFSSLFLMITCNVILIHNLLSKSQWRRQAMINLSEKTDPKSVRDKKVLKMVILISSIFIICLLPNCLLLILKIHFPSDFNVIGRYKNSFQMSWALVNTLESVNGSINILVYHNMSSKFRTSFNRLFGIASLTQGKVKAQVSKLVT